MPAYGPRRRYVVSPANTSVNNIHNTLLSHGLNNPIPQRSTSAAGIGRRRRRADLGGAVAAAAGRAACDLANPAVIADSAARRRWELRASCRTLPPRRTRGCTGRTPCQVQNGPPLRRPRPAANTARPTPYTQRHRCADSQAGHRMRPPMLSRHSCESPPAAPATNSPSTAAQTAGEGNHSRMPATRRPAQ